MSDTSLNKIIQYGTTAARVAYTPNPASGSQVLYIWYDTDNTPDTYIWDGSAWVQINATSSGITQLTGDVTAGPGSGSQAATIANNAVTTAKILDDNVTYAKIQNVSATDKILGRDTAGAGNIEELDVSGGLEFTGTGIQRSALTGDVTASAGNNATTIANDAVTTAKILDANVTLAKIANAAANSKLLGSGAAGSGAPYAELTLGTNLSMSGTTLNATGGGSGNVTDTTAFGSEPGSPLSGDLDLYNNAPLIARYSGSAWSPWGPIWNFTAPVNGDFSWANQGTATVSTTNGGVYLDAAASGGTNDIKQRLKTAPSTPYTITAALIINVYPVQFNSGGLFFRQSSDGKLATLGLGWSGGNTHLISAKYTNATTFSATYVDLTVNLFPNIIWFRIVDNGTNRICSYSMDGFNFIQIHSVGRTDFLTADQVGFFVNPANATGGGGVHLLSWAQA